MPDPKVGKVQKALCWFSLEWTLSDCIQNPKSPLYTSSVKYPLTSTAA